MGEPMRLAFGRKRVDDGMGVGQIAPVLDVVAELPQRFDDSRRAQHCGSHRRAGDARARFDRRAENGYRPPPPAGRLRFGTVLAARLSVQDPPP